MSPKDPSGSTRRRFLQAFGAGITATGVAGCVGRSIDTDTDSVIGYPGIRSPSAHRNHGASDFEQAYRRHENGLRWHSTPVTFVVGTSTYPDDLDEDAVTDAVTRSFETWNAVSDTERVFDEPRFDDELDGITPENDVNEIVWEEMPDDSLGRAHWRWATGTSRLLEVDIRLNPDRDWFVDETEAGDAAFDVESVLLHELGHNALRDTKEGVHQTMYHETDTGETKKRTLGAGDEAGWRDAYGSQ